MKINVLCKPITIFLIVIVFISCVKNSSTAPPVKNPTVAQLIKTATNLTILNAALVRSGLDTVLNNPDSMVTMFVCTDQIMNQYGLNISVIDTMNVDVLKKLLEYSILLGEARLSSALINGTGQNVKIDSLASGDSIFVTYTGTNLYINGISVPTTDVSASNGYLDVMAQPLFPPAGTILQITQADTTLSYFDTAVARTSSSTLFNIQSLLTGGGIYTVLVPNNNAFRNAGFLNVDTFKTLPADTVAKLLAYHIINNRYFTSDMGIAIGNVGSSDTATQVTLSTNTIKVIFGAAYYQAEGNSDSVSANIYAPNIMARNGVVHKIDRVLRQ